MSTKVRVIDSKYGKMFQIWKVLGITSEGEEITPERSEIQFGIKKAKMIMNNVDELKKFVGAESDEDAI